MKIASFFVDLGIAGAGATNNALGQVNQTLGNMKLSTLAAKAGILGVLYTVERLASGSAHTGANLMSFAAATGLSTEALQKYQYQASLANVSTEEVKGSIVGLQQSMLRMSQGGAAPSGFNFIADAIGIDRSKVNDTIYLMDKLSEYAKANPNVAFANEQLQSMGLSLDMIAAMRRGFFDNEKLAKAPTYGKGEIAALDSVNAGYTRLHNQWEMGIGHLTAKFGPRFINDLVKVSREVMKTTDAFARMAEKIQLMKGIGMIFEGWGYIFKGISSAVDGMNEFLEKRAQLAQEDEKSGLGWFANMRAKSQQYEKDHAAEIAAQTKYIAEGHTIGDELFRSMWRRMNPTKEENKAMTMQMTNYIHATDGADVVNQVKQLQTQTQNKIGKTSPALKQAH